MGLKLHEDWGTTPAAIDNALNVAEQYDIQALFMFEYFFCIYVNHFEFQHHSPNVFHLFFGQVNIHTDTLNESGFVEHSIAAFKGRTIHTYHRYNLHAACNINQKKKKN